MKKPTKTIALVKETGVPCMNADVFDLAEQRRQNALFILGILISAYVPRNTTDYEEGLNALQQLGKGSAAAIRNQPEVET